MILCRWKKCPKSGNNMLCYHIIKPQKLVLFLFCTKLIIIIHKTNILMPMCIYCTVMESEMFHNLFPQMWNAKKNCRYLISSEVANLRNNSHLLYALSEYIPLHYILIIGNEWISSFQKKFLFTNILYHILLITSLHIFCFLWIV